MQYSVQVCEDLSKFLENISVTCEHIISCSINLKFSVKTSTTALKVVSGYYITTKLYHILHPSKYLLN